MRLTIKLLDILPEERTIQLIKKIENLFVKEGISYEIMQELSNHDTWDNLDIESISVDTGIEDFAENHDHYLYGTPKIS